MTSNQSKNFRDIISAEESEYNLGRWVKDWEEVNRHLYEPLMQRTGLTLIEALLFVQNDVMSRMALRLSAAPIAMVRLRDEDEEGPPFEVPE